MNTYRIFSTNGCVGLVSLIVGLLGLASSATAAHVDFRSIHGAADQTPPFYSSPPYILEMDGFTLYVQSWQSSSWDLANQRITSANGIAWAWFGCQPEMPLPFSGVSLSARPFKIVEVVSNPAEEIRLEDAKKLDAQATVGSTITLRIPVDAQTASEIAEDLDVLFRWPLYTEDAIQLQLNNLTIAPGRLPFTGTVLSGTATYPVGDSAPVALPIQGFTVQLSALTITPQGASAGGVLQMPPSIIDPGTGHPGQVMLGTFSVTPQCTFHDVLPNLTYGPWEVGSTDMQIQGKGVVADFDSSWSSPSAPAHSAAASPSWEGVLLGPGTTAASASNAIISNSGYLHGLYSYHYAEVVAAGLTAQFNLTNMLSFQTLQPFQYTVESTTGTVNLSNSAVAGGQFGTNKITAPVHAASDGASGPGSVVALAPILHLDAQLNLLGPVQVTTPIAWGEYSKHPLSHTYYFAQQFLRAGFYISGTNQLNYFPLDAQDDFAQSQNPCSVQYIVIEPPPPTEPPAAAAEPSLLPGLTACFPASLEVRTTDTPNAAPLDFVPLDRDKVSWLNITFDGVHGSFVDFASRLQSSTDLGPLGQPFYLGQSPFKAASTNPKLPARYSLTMNFVSSSLYDANLTGAVALPVPVGNNLSFSNMGFTSTAQISAAQVPLSSPVPLTFWGLSLVKRAGATVGAVMDVHTGQIFFTAAGIAETRHFRLPFYLTWGQMLANGQLGDLVFDPNSAGQQFDGFYYTPSFVKLSNYSPGTTAYIKTAGTVSFDFFGTKYINVNDSYVPNNSSPPYNSRSIALMSDVDPQGAYHATDTSLSANWSNGLGTFNFSYGYDTNAQDGFIGTGSAQLMGVSAPLTSSVVLKADPLICISVSSTARVSVSLGPLPNFGVMGGISGCGCVNNGQLQSMMLTGDLENDNNFNVILSSASYGSIQWMITPSLAQLEFQGDMYLTVLQGSHMEVNGLAQFTVDWTQAYVDGNVQGHFDTSELLGFESLTADGQLDWHVSAPVNAASYQELQGNLSVGIVAPVGGSSIEGGLYVGINAPTSEAWILNAGGSKFQLNTAALPAQLTGVYGYAQYSESINLWILSGGVEAYAGLGGFVLPAASVGPLNAVAPGAGIGLPYVIGNTGIHVWGAILGGLASADGWVDLNVISPYPFSFQGTLGLQACAAWVICETADLTAGLNSTSGLYVQ
jgi:hypothetical protein